MDFWQWTVVSIIVTKDIEHPIANNPTCAHLHHRGRDRSLSTDGIQSCPYLARHSLEKCPTATQTIARFQTTSLHWGWLGSTLHGLRQQVWELGMVVRKGERGKNKQDRCLISHTSIVLPLWIVSIWVVTQNFSTIQLNQRVQKHLGCVHEGSTCLQTSDLTLPPMTIWWPPQPWSVPPEVFGVVVRPISLDITIVILSHNPKLTSSSRKPLSTGPISRNFAFCELLRSKWVSYPPSETAKVSLFTLRASPIPLGNIGT